MGTILLFYKYVSITNPHHIMEWQKTLCTQLQLKGRILIAHEGINGTVGGSPENITLYIDAMQKNDLFADIDFKPSTGDASCFPRLYVTVREEIVRLKLDHTQANPQDAGTHLTPTQVHALIKDNPNDLVIFDARNTYESKIGKFNNAITPDINYFRELPTFIDDNLELFKEKQVLMYCTGGIRCERASAYLKSKNICSQVYQLEGGIHRYIEQYPNGFFRGKNYVFDGRIALTANNDILSNCMICNTACNDYQNCSNALCNNHFIVCNACYQQLSNTCSISCKELIESHQGKSRPPFEKYSS